MTSTINLVDGFADQITNVAERMEAAGVSADYRVGAASILKEVAADMRFQVRRTQLVPGRVNFDSIQAFGGRQLQAASTNERKDVPAQIVKMFAAANVALPQVGQTVSPATVEAVLQGAGVPEGVDRMYAKRIMERAKIVDFGDRNLLFGAS